MRMLLCMQKVSLPVRHVGYLSREHQFSGGYKSKQAKPEKKKKITLQTFANTFPTSQITGPLSKSSSITGSTCVSKLGTNRQPPSTAKL